MYPPQANLLQELEQVLEINTQTESKKRINRDPVVVRLKFKGTNIIGQTFVQKRGSLDDMWFGGECNPMNKSSWNSEDCPPLPMAYFHQNGCSHKYRCCTMKVLDDGSYYRDPAKICPLQWWQFEDDPEKERLGTCPRFFKFPPEVEPKIA